MTSSPMVLMTVPWRCSVALRMTSMQIATISRARTSPIRSYSRVDPTTSANRIASSMSLPMQCARLYATLSARLLTQAALTPGRNRPDAATPRRRRARAPLRSGRGGIRAPRARRHTDRACGARSVRGGRRGPARAPHSRACARAAARAGGARPGAKARCSSREQERPVIGLAPEHHPVAPGRAPQSTARAVRRPPLTTSGSVGKAALHSPHHVVAQRRNLAVVLGRQPAEHRLAGVHDRASQPAACTRPTNRTELEVAPR